VADTTDPVPLWIHSDAETRRMGIDPRCAAHLVASDAEHLGVRFVASNTAQNVSSRASSVASRGASVEPTWLVRAPRSYAPSDPALAVAAVTEAYSVATGARALDDPGFGTVSSEKVTAVDEIACNTCWVEDLGR